MMISKHGQILLLLFKVKFARKTVAEIKVFERAFVTHANSIFLPTKQSRLV